MIMVPRAGVYKGACGQGPSAPRGLFQPRGRAADALCIGQQPCFHVLLASPMSERISWYSLEMHFHTVVFFWLTELKEKMSDPLHHWLGYNLEGWESWSSEESTNCNTILQWNLSFCKASTCTRLVMSRLLCTGRQWRILQSFADCMIKVRLDPQRAHGLSRHLSFYTSKF